MKVNSCEKSDMECKGLGLHGYSVTLSGQRLFSEPTHKNKPIMALDRVTSTNLDFAKNALSSFSLTVFLFTLQTMTPEQASQKQMAIAFAAEFAYYRANPETKMDVPSMVYENAEKAFNNWIERHNENPTYAVNPFKK